ncbi:serine protease inhibitor 42Dd-like [Cochliomyia hominivorax]
MTSLKNKIGWLLGLLVCMQFNNLLAGKIESREDGLNPKLFASDIYTAIMEGKLSSTNAVFSPFSIQTALAMAYLGADAQTAESMRNVLRLGSETQSKNAQEFGKLLTEALSSDNPNAPQFKMADRIYVNEFYALQPDFNKLSSEHFNAIAKNIKFQNEKLAADEINHFVSEATNNRIAEIVKKEELSSKTAAILVNSIYFKGQWKNPFDAKNTQNSYFNTNSEKKKLVKMMHYTGHFYFADLPELDATALQLPYNNSDISMLIILPNALEGLEKLESKLKDWDLSDITSKTKLGKVCVDMPRFHVEQEIELKEPLSKLGLSDIFTEKANFEKLVQSTEKISMSYVRHKTFLDVNEYGSEASESSVTEHGECYKEITRFQADHPFVFAILNDKIVYMTGHIFEPYIRTAFKLGQENKDEIIAGFGKLLQGLTSSSKPDASQFKLANRIYVNEYYRLNEEFNNKAKKYFGAQAKSIDFVKHRLAAAEINEWVEEQTTHKVKDLMKETDLGEKTTAVLVSASYFQGKWMRQFSEDKTEEGLFKVDNEQIKRVQMMHNKAHYKYADLPELEASALELPYKNSNISMLIILPKEITGLQKLEASLYNADFNDISFKMQMSNNFQYI